MTPAEVLSLPMPAITEEGTLLAHGKLLRSALYDTDPLKRGAARRAIALLLDLADFGDA